MRNLSRNLLALIIFVGLPFMAIIEWSKDYNKKSLWFHLKNEFHEWNEVFWIH